MDKSKVSGRSIFPIAESLGIANAASSKSKLPGAYGISGISGTFGMSGTYAILEISGTFGIEGAFGFLILGIFTFIFPKKLEALPLSFDTSFKFLALTTSAPICSLILSYPILSALALAYSANYSLVGIAFLRSPMFILESRFAD